MTSPPQHSPRYVVGIDLGTTNSALSFVDLESNGRIEDFRILQVVAPGETERRDSLPSFLYEAAPGEADQGAFDLPWSADRESTVVGVLARDRGALAPGRMVASAKSWLCHAGVDRTANILPWHGAPDVRKRSPVETTARYLSHMRGAWNHDHPGHPLESQDVVVAIPASFDEVARELTVQALVRAGIGKVTLIEEPQAAFYAWMASQADEEKPRILPGQIVLVCDVGGGTTDFTLIETVAATNGELSFRRIAVGDHLILGGDNLDLALAHHLEARLAVGRKLDSRQWSVLVRLCAQAKERLLGANAPDSLMISLPAAGSRLIGGSLQAEISREETLRVLVDGFLPETSSNAIPERGGSGFREFGLPYAADPAITRYLAEFLKRHARRTPDAVLLNGGFFESPALRSRMLAVLASWAGAAPPPLALRNDRLDMAVARGAAQYGMVRRGKGVRIASGLPRSYYVGVADAHGKLAAVCVAPSGLEEGSGSAAPGRVFDLLLRQPVEFPLFASTLRTADAAGDVVEIDPLQLTALPPMRTVLKTSKKAVRATVQVGLFCRATEIGTFEVWCREIDGDRQWQLQFDLRAQPDVTGLPSSPAPAATIEESAATACADAIRQAFAAGDGALGALPRNLEEGAGLPRNEWPPALLRRLWATLADQAETRQASPSSEARWLNLAGFFLRPGFGVALDDMRIDEIWKQFPRGVAHAKNELCRAEWCILWRRIAGGLNEGRQATLADPLLRRLKSGKGSLAGGPHETAEAWRLLACLERLPLEPRRSLGDRRAERLRSKGWSAENGAAAWALARIAARVPLYGPLNTGIESERASEWIAPLLTASSPREENLFEVALMARRTGDRYRDVDDDTRARVLNWLHACNASPHVVALVEVGGDLDSGEQTAAAGDSLPVGLRWSHA